MPPTSRVLIVEIEDEPIGLLVDSVKRVWHMSEHSLEMKADLDADQRDNYVIGVARPMSDRMFVIIDLPVVLLKKGPGISET